MSSVPHNFDDFDQALGGGHELFKQRTNTLTQAPPQDPEETIQNCWADVLFTNHDETSQFAVSANVVDVTSGLALTLSGEKQLRSGLLNDVSFSTATDTTNNEEDPLLDLISDQGGVALLPPISLIFEQGLMEPNCTLLGNDVVASDDVNAIEALPDIAFAQNMPVEVEEPGVAFSESSKANRKRHSTSESSALSFTKGSGKKKGKLYQDPDKSNPKVKRAGYAHVYRETKKKEKERLKEELKNANEYLEHARDKIKKLEENQVEQINVVSSLEESVKQKKAEIHQLRIDLSAEREKNSLTPHQTEKLLKSIVAVVKGSCAPDKDVQVIVSERLASKHGAAIGGDKIAELCTGDHLRTQPCTFVFDIAEKRTY